MTSLSTSEQQAASLTLPLRTKALLLFFLCVGCLLQGCTYSHLTAFFNKYAVDEKSLSSSQYGIIMGSYCFAIMVVTPLAAKLVTLRRVRDKAILFFGWTVDAVFCMAMASVCRLAAGYAFFVGSLTLRVLEAVGCAVGFFMLYIVLGAELSEINHIVIPVIETVYGVSVVIGPAFSGVLYDHGGFQLPFLVLGGALLALTLLGVATFPKPRPIPADQAHDKPPSMLVVIRGPIVVNVLCSLSTFTLISFNESTLALRLNEKFDMSASESGFVFLYAGGLYAVSSLLLGYLSRRVSDARYFVLFGQVLIVIALVIQAPLVPIEQTKGTIYFAQMLFGIGTGPAFVCSYLHSLKYLANGAETKETYAVLSAIFAPMTALGGTLGPLIAGVIIDFYSYETVVAINAVQTALVVLGLAITIVVTRPKAARSEPTV